MKIFKVTVIADDGKTWGTTFRVTEEAAKDKSDKVLALLALDSLVNKMETEIVQQIP